MLPLHLHEIAQFCVLNQHILQPAPDKKKIKMWLSIHPSKFSVWSNASYLHGSFKQLIHMSSLLQITIKFYGATHLWNTIWKTRSHLLSGNLTSSEQVLTVPWLICKAIQALKYICTLSVFQILRFCFHFQNVFIYTLIFDLWIFQVYMEPAVLNSGYTEHSCKTSGDIIGYF